MLTSEAVTAGRRVWSVCLLSFPDRVTDATSEAFILRLYRDATKASS